MNTEINTALYEEIEFYLDNIELIINKQWPDVEQIEDFYSEKITGQKYTFKFIADLNVFSEKDIREIVTDNHGIYFKEKIESYMYFDPVINETNIYFERELNNLNIYIEIFI